MATFTSSTFGSYLKKWLVIVGVFELLLGAGFVVGAVLLPEVKGGFLITAGILGVVGLALVIFGVRAGARAAEAARIDQTGLAGTGTITGVTQTGMFLNQNPQVEVDLLVQIPGRAAYPARRKEFIPLILLGRLAPGATVAVKVDPSDSSKVIIDWDQPAPAATPGVTSPLATGEDETLSQVQEALRGSGLQAAQPFVDMQQGQYTVEQLRQYLRVNGLPGTATIERIEDSGKTVGDERLFTMEVTVEVPGRRPHRGPASAAMVPKHLVSRMSVGRKVPVKVAADNPDMVMFEWDKI